MAETTLYPDIDTYMQGNAADTNFGTAGLFGMGEAAYGDHRLHTLIKPDLSSIPAASICLSATLTLTVQADNADYACTVGIYRCLRNWTEGGATWNRYDGSNTWQTGGATGALDAESTAIATQTQPASPPVGSTIVWTLTPSLLHEMWNGTWTNYGFVLRETSGDGNLIQYYSSDCGTPSYYPALYISYTTPTGSGPRVVGLVGGTHGPTPTSLKAQVRARNRNAYY